MKIPQVQGSPAMEFVEGKIKRRSVSGLNAVGGETSITLFNLFCSNVSKPDEGVCRPFNHSFSDCVPVMICFVFIILLSFTTAFHFISSFSTPLPLHLRLLKFLCSFILLR